MGAGQTWEVMPEMVVLKYVFRHISTFVKF